MDGNGLKETKSDRNRVETSASIPRRPFKWFVLLTYAIFSPSLAMSEIIFAPIPKQTAAYYGIKGQYFQNGCTFKNCTVENSICMLIHHIHSIQICLKKLTRWTGFILYRCWLIFQLAFLYFILFILLAWRNPFG